MRYDSHEETPTRRQFLRSGLIGVAACMAYPIVRVPEVLAESADAGRVRFTVLSAGACRPCRKFIDRLIEGNRAELSRCFPEGAEVFFVLGKELENLPARAIAIGDCASCFREKAALFIPGCPPSEQIVRETILRAHGDFKRTEHPDGKSAVLFGLD